MTLPKIPSLGTTESFLLLTAAAVVVYVAYKTQQAGQGIADSVVQTYNNAKQAVSDTVAGANGMLKCNSCEGATWMCDLINPTWQNGCTMSPRDNTSLSPIYGSNYDRIDAENKVNAPNPYAELDVPNIPTTFASDSPTTVVQPDTGM